MTGLLDIIRDPLSLFTLVIAVGIILIIIAAVPSLSVFILKSASFTLSKRQSITVAAIGVVLIIIGSVGILALNQLERAPNGEVFIRPQQPVTVLSNGTPLKISVVTSDPNIFQKIFDEPKGFKFTFFILDSNPNGSRHVVAGPNNSSQFIILPDDAGNKIIEVNVTDISKNREYNIYRENYLINRPANGLPIINNISYERSDDNWTWIKVDATDPENDFIYYKFTTPKSEIKPRWDYKENFRYLEPDKNDAGKKFLDVCIQDGDNKGPWKDHNPVCKHELIYV